MRIVIYLGVLLVLLGFGSPGGGLIGLPISFLLKNGLGSAAACSGRNGSRYRGVEGSGRKLFGGSVPVKKRGPWAVADLRVVTPPGDPD